MTTGFDAPDDGTVEIAFAGRSNVGKSSLLNTMMSRHSLVRTSSTPGCTRQVNIFDARLANGLRLHLVDLPGFGFAQRSKAERNEWGTLIESYLTGRPSLRGLVVLVDIRRGVEEEERMLLEYISEARKPELAKVSTIFVGTKIDKVSKSDCSLGVKRILKDSGCPSFGFSAQTGEGRVELWRALRRLLNEAAPCATIEPSAS
jgi:GTP-binding protein